jgi:hypothetical protein
MQSTGQQAFYLQYLKDGKLPDWEVPNMLAKALEIAQQKK